jgi:hypothetical protein
MLSSPLFFFAVWGGFFFLSVAIPDMHISLFHEEKTGF